LPQATDPRMLGFSGPAGTYGSAPLSDRSIADTPMCCFPDPGPARQGDAMRSPVVAASYTAPISSPQSTEAGLSTRFPQNKDPGTDPGRGLSRVPTGAGDLLPLVRPVTMGHSDATASPPGPAGSLPPSDQFKYVQDRLRQLGATYFVLETCGDEKRDFRFYCRMSVGGNPRVTQPFWCFDSDPLKAMTQVLKQVEDWQSGGGEGQRK
jgi:hypothetical protein